MAYIELLIKIPEEVKNRLCFGVTYPKDIQVVCEALNDGTQLPKGHGRLIDENDLSLMTVHMIDGVLVCDAPTIIESDMKSGGNE